VGALILSEPSAKNSGFWSWWYLQARRSR